ncbi:MAG: amino acid permease [Candidatus Melainabacteria bacterium]|nr:amino acid permease [Candidatus Melainabacteria bacterium]
MKNKAKLFLLIPIIFFSVSGGPYGLEEIVSSVGPFFTLLFILILPIIWTIPESMIVAELSSSYPLQGGYYKWVQIGLGRFWGFMEGWWSVLYTLIDLSIYPILFTLYLKYLIPDLNFWSIYSIQLLMIWSCAVINILGVRFVGYVLVIFKIFILISFLLFIFFCIVHSSFNLNSITSFPCKWDTEKFLFGVSLAFWNFIGWDNGSTILGEVEKPDSNYHKALFITIPIVVFFYFFPVLVGLGIHQDAYSWKFGEFSFIAKSMNHSYLAIILAIGGMIATLGLFNSLLLSSSRIFLMLAKDKLFPDVFSKIHKTQMTPYIVIIFLAIVYSLLVLLSIEKLIVYDVFLYLSAMLLEAIALLVLRKRSPNIKSDFKIPFGDLGLYFVVSLAISIILLMIGINILGFNGLNFGSIISLGLIFSGIPVYFYFTTQSDISRV